MNEGGARPARLLVVWTSMTGGTRQLAEAVARGASRGSDADPSAGEGERDPASRAVEVVLRHAREADGSDLLAADGYVFATPENLASMAGLMKDFFDRSYYAALDRVAGRPYAAIVCAGSDGEGAARQLARIATGLRLRPMAEPLIVRVDAQTPAKILAPKTIASPAIVQAEELGEALAAGLSMRIW